MRGESRLALYALVFRIASVRRRDAAIATYGTGTTRRPLLAAWTTEAAAGAKPGARRNPAFRRHSPL